MHPTEMTQPNSAQEEEKKSGKKLSVPQQIIDFYSPYRRKMVSKSSVKSVIVMGTRFELEEKYEVIDAGTLHLHLDISDTRIFGAVVGQGAYGVVVAARDRLIPPTESNLVAIKKIEKAFEHRIFTKRTLRELKILRLLRHENVP
jgi:hypothetical protein